MTGEAEPHRPVQAAPEVLADLRAKADELDTRELTRLALGLGLAPPQEPAGYQGWEIVVAYPDEDFGTGVLYWLGPQPDHGGEDYPAEGDESGDDEAAASDPWG
ncbi:hypothetical protein LO763_18795 [Glycomyces sp. A-F 0318]|uniref:hypothetical protein n=1 Tax=Glycomyces amatae TaxID=2881355 RepID=UPI001E53DE4B|nr:hypothetical protein [Glycomyces amatae]MCD0445658.1 hypothetical protein [Glycomyces amatae]